VGLEPATFSLVHWCSAVWTRSPSGRHSHKSVPKNTFLHPNVAYSDRIVDGST